MKIRIVFITLMVSFYSWAQENIHDEKIRIPKKTTTLGGNLNFSSNAIDSSRPFSTSNTSNTFFGLQPRIGYFVSDNVEIGLGVEYSVGSGNSIQRDSLLILEQDNSNNSLGVIPYFRAYKPLNKNLLLYVQAEFRYVVNWFESQNNFNNLPSSGNGYRLELGINPGVTYFISKKMALEASLAILRYSYLTQETEFNNDNDNTNFQEASSSVNEFNFSINPSNIFFGLSYYF